MGHQQLNQSDPSQWHGRPVPWRKGFADAAGKLGLHQYGVLKTACLHANDPPHNAVVMLDIDGTLVDDSQGFGAPQVLLPGRLEALKKLKSQGIRLYCVTNRTARKNDFEQIEAMNEQLLDMCEGTIDKVYWLAKPGPLLKPSGFMLRACMEQNGFGPDDAIFVGNSPDDEGAALDAGVPYADHTEFFGECEKLANAFRDIMKTHKALEDLRTVHKPSYLKYLDEMKQQGIENTKEQLQGAGFAPKKAEWSSDKNRDVHVDKHAPEFGGPQAYLSFEKVLEANPDLRATFKPVNQRCDERGCTTGTWSPTFRMMHVVNDDGKTVTLYRKDKSPL